MLKLLKSAADTSPSYIQELSREQIFALARAHRRFEDACFKRLADMPSVCYTCERRAKSGFSWSTIISSNLAFIKLWTHDPVIALRILINDLQPAPTRRFDSIYSWTSSGICKNCIDTAKHAFQSDLDNIWAFLNNVIPSTEQAT